ncbi:MAG: HincII family type II restriction endonuclease [Bacteroidaceae bacterium]|nr:HincII family type II restriction endonuclease [Bacteroidaceae bacterium]
MQFHVSDLDQSWKGSREEWARQYLKMMNFTLDPFVCLLTLMVSTTMMKNL